MTKSVEDILRDGFGVWRRNPVLILPFLLRLVVLLLGLLLSLLVVLVIYALLLFIFVLPMIGGFGGDVRGISLILSLTIVAFTVTAFIMVVSLMLLINAFFLGGAVGMSKRAMETGKTSLSEMIDYGRMKFISLFFATVIIFLITTLGILLLLIPAFIAFASNSMGLGLSLLLLGIIIWLAYTMVLDFVFAPVPYAVVIDDLGAIEGVKEGYGFFMENKLSVFFLWVVIHAIPGGCSIILGVLTSLIGIIPILGILINIVLWFLYMIFTATVISSLSVMWWTHIYLDKSNLESLNHSTKLIDLKNQIILNKT